MSGFISNNGSSTGIESDSFQMSIPGNQSGPVDYSGFTPVPERGFSGGKKTHGGKKSKPSSVVVAPKLGFVKPSLSASTPIPPPVDNTAMFSRAVATPIGPADMIGIRTNRNFEFEINENVTTPLSQSDRFLRSYSPFIISIEPPLVYSESGGFLSKKTNSVSTDFSPSVGGLSGYEVARRSLSQSGINKIPTSSRGASVADFVFADSRGQTRPQNGLTNKVTRHSAPAIADLYSAVDQATQLSAVLNTPPLVLFVNPSSFSVTSAKIQQYQSLTRKGVPFSAWGEEQNTISISMTCGAFVSGSRGVTTASRHDSLAWENIMSLLYTYKNAGYIVDSVNKTTANHMVGCLSIRWDGWTYYGHMGSFSFPESDEKQNGGIEISIDFVVSAADHSSDQPSFVQPMLSPTKNPPMAYSPIGLPVPSINRVRQATGSSRDNVSPVVNNFIPAIRLGS